MDPFELDDPTADDLAFALRGQAPEGLSRDRRFATIAALGGKRAADLAAQFGANAAAGERQQQAQAGNALRVLLGRQAAAQRAAVLAAQENERRAAQARWEADYAQRERLGPTMAVVPGPGGALFRVPTRGGGAAQPVTTTDGAPVVKPPETKPLSSGERDELQNLTTAVENAETVLGAFRPDFAGRGWTGGAQESFAKALGDTAPQSMQDFAQFWSMYDEFINLPLRNKTFGASLSAGEKQSWEGARRIKPGSDPDKAKQALEQMLGIARAKLGARASAARVTAPAAEVDALTRGKDKPPAPAASTSSAPPVPGAFKTKSGRWAVMGDDGKAVYVEDK